MIKGPEMTPVCWEERAALHVCFLHLINPSNCWKDGHILECSFCSQDSKHASCLTCSYSDDANFMFVVTPETFVFLTRQSQKNDVNPEKEKVQIKSVKDTYFVDLSRSAHPVTNVLRVVEGIHVGACPGSKGFESTGCFDIEEELQPKIQNQTFSHQGTSNKECTFQSPQEQLPEGGIAFPPPKTYRGKGQNPVFFGIYD